MASIGKFTGLTKGRLDYQQQVHVSATSKRTASVPGNMRFTFSIEEEEDDVLSPLGMRHRLRSVSSTMPGARLTSGLKRTTSFSCGESLVEASVSKHPDVELVDNGKGSTFYALRQNFAIVRHADRLDRTTDWDAHPDSQKWVNDTPLSRFGHEHATETAEGLKNSGKPFGLIVSSPYLRCAQTASRIAQVMKLPIQFDLDLGEVFDKSSMVGSVDGPQHRDPELLEASLLKDFPDVKWVKDEDNKIKIEGSQQKFPESLDAARMRFSFKVQQLLQRAASKLISVIIVTHGDALGCVIGMMQKDWKITNVPYASYALASREVMVLEKGSMEIKSDEPVYEQEWTLKVSAGLKYEEVHPCSKKRKHALHAQDIRKMNARHSNASEIDTAYLLDDEKVENYTNILNELGANSLECGRLAKQAGQSQHLANMQTKGREHRILDTPRLLKRNAST